MAQVLIMVCMVKDQEAAAHFPLVFVEMEKVAILHMASMEKLQVVQQLSGPDILMET